MVQYTDLPIGRKYIITDNISLFIDYSHTYDGIGLNGYVPNSNIYSDLITLGVSYKF